MVFLLWFACGAIGITWECRLCRLLDLDDMHPARLGFRFLQNQPWWFLPLCLAGPFALFTAGRIQIAKWQDEAAQAKYRVELAAWEAHEAQRRANDDLIRALRQADEQLEQIRSSRD